MQVDAFTAEAFHGNPAAVVFVHDQALSSEQMQTIAAENNLSETAYLEHEDQGQIADLAYFSTASTFRLRCATFRRFYKHAKGSTSARLQSSLESSLYQQELRGKRLCWIGETTCLVDACLCTPNLELDHSSMQYSVSLKVRYLVAPGGSHQLLRLRYAVMPPWPLLLPSFKARARYSPFTMHSLAAVNRIALPQFNSRVAFSLIRL